MIYRNIQRNAIRKSAIGSKLTELQIEKIADLMEIKKYHDGEVVLRKGSKLGMKLFILLEGEHVQTVILDLGFLPLTTFPRVKQRRLWLIEGPFSGQVTCSARLGLSSNSD